MNSRDSSSPAAGGSGAPCRKVISVLLIDDQPIVGEQVRRMLADESDIAFRYCGDPTQALSAIHESAPTVMLLDLTMPGIGGLQLLRAFRDAEQIRNIPAIILSSKDDSQIKADAFALGASDYLVKLPDAVELIARIRLHSLSYIHLLEHRRSTAALRQAEINARRSAELAQRANRAKSVFLANMGHELRTPLNAVLGYAQLLLENRSKFDSDQLYAIENIAAGGRQLYELIENILTLSQLEEGDEALERDEFEMETLVRRLDATFQARCEYKGLAWRTEIGFGARRVLGDERKLQQILVHLLDNAVKFTEEGEVVMRAREERDGLYTFEVVDTGPGITPERQEEIFGVFNQGEDGIEKGGTGMGLAIARRHVALMGGHLELESDPGRGTRASFAVGLVPIHNGGVGFSPSAGAAEDTGEAPPLVFHIALPEALMRKFEQAMAMHSISDLRLHIDEVEGLGEEGRRLAVHLRALSQQYDMVAIGAVLAEVGHR